MVPRADKILMREGIEVETGSTLKSGVLYSDNSYIEDGFWRFVIASVYTNSSRTSGVELRESTYEEVDCPMKTRRCYTYRRQNINSYNLTILPYGEFFYSSYMVERRIPRKMIKLDIESNLISVKVLTGLLHLGFRHRVGKHITEYRSIRDFYVLV